MKPMKLWLALLLLLAPLRAVEARVVASFYSHELGSTFPHAFFTLEGALEGSGEKIATNYGFTAKAVTPAVLFGPVVGVVESAKPSYIANSDKRFSIALTDAQYAAVMEVVKRWQQMPGKSYDLNKRNCIHFVGHVAQAIGLNVVFEKGLLKKPRSFLEHVVKLNPWVRDGR